MVAFNAKHCRPAIGRRDWRQTTASRERRPLHARANPSPSAGMHFVKHRRPVALHFAFNSRSYIQMSREVSLPSPSSACTNTFHLLLCMHITLRESFVFPAATLLRCCN